MGGKFTLYQPIILYRKFLADTIFDGYKFRQSQVLITTDTGVIVEFVDEQDAGEDVARMDGILCPGFINAHCHLELSHMKGLIQKQTGLVDFVKAVVNERHFGEDEIAAAIEAAEKEMWQNGIVAVGDICNNGLTIPQKSKGRLQYHNFIETAGFPPTVAESRFAKAKTIVNQYRSANNDKQTGFCGRTTINPHAAYSVSPQLFTLINEFPENDILTIHNQETGAENEFFKTGTGDLLRMYQQMGIDISFFEPSGRSSLQTWLPYFTKGQTLILVHNVCTTEEDLVFAKLPIRRSLGDTHPQAPEGSSSPIFICLCVNANLYISNSLPDVPMLMKHGDNLVIGTDSLASNDQLSILAELKTIQQQFNDIDLATILQWATSNGARALHMHNSLGSFEKGKQPGVVLISGTDRLRLNNMSSVTRVV